MDNFDIISKILNQLSTFDTNQNVNSGSTSDLVNNASIQQSEKDCGNSKKDISQEIEKNKKNKDKDQIQNDNDSEDNSIIKGRWSEQEDARLLAWKIAEKSWEDIAKYFPNRTIKSIRGRWRRYTKGELDEFLKNKKENPVKYQEMLDMANKILSSEEVLAELIRKNLLDEEDKNSNDKENVPKINSSIRLVEQEATKCNTLNSNNKTDISHQNNASILNTIPSINLNQIMPSIPPASLTLSSLINPTMPLNLPLAYNPLFPSNTSNPSNIPLDILEGRNRVNSLHTIISYYENNLYNLKCELLLTEQTLKSREESYQKQVLENSTKRKKISEDKEHQISMENKSDRSRNLKSTKRKADKSRNIEPEDTSPLEVIEILDDPKSEISLTINKKPKKAKKNKTKPSPAFGLFWSENEENEDTKFNKENREKIEQLFKKKQGDIRFFTNISK